MPSKLDIQSLAQSRLKEAELLFKAEHYEAAFYLAGFSIEIAFKAVICKKLDISLKEMESIQSFKSHNFEQLLLISGLRNKHSLAASRIPNFKNKWSIVTDWKVDCRYSTPGQKKKVDVEKFIKAIKFILSWINKYW
jgi:HEPN domain-containing protein